jgi:glycosyltransferase involved in cell wall biosynthesis
MTLHGLESALLADIRDHADLLDAVVVTNRLSEALAADALGHSGRVFYAPYGVPLRSPVVAAHGGVPGELALLYCGRLEQGQKRVGDLAKILLTLRKRNIKCRLSVAGGGPHEDAFRDELKDLGVLDDVHFLGVLDAGELAGQYASHDALLVTSSWETGPIVAWEAMSHGLPVISSRYVGSGREGALRDGENCLLFPVGDAGAAACRVAALADESLRARLVEGGANLVRERYSREASVSQWNAALHNVLSLEPVPRPGPESKQQKRSRLDKLLGNSRAEHARRLLRLQYPHRNPGGEWPHSAHKQRDPLAWLGELGSFDVAPRPSSDGRHHV